jgi:hypothetical protein
VASALGGVAVANHSSLEHVSTGQLNLPAGFEGTSADGARVFFSTEEQLVAADTDGSIDIYERSAGATRLVSAGQINGNGAFGVWFDACSADGSRVFFSTQEQLVAADTDGSFDIYERSAGATRLVSAGQINGNGAFGVVFEDISVDGSRAVFRSNERLVLSDTDAAQDVYERAGGATRRVSVGQVNGNGAFDAYFEAASADGRRVFFGSREPLVAGDGDAFADVYERSNRATGLVTGGEINGDGDFDAIGGAVSDDGSRLFFVTEEQLVTADTDTARDLYESSGGATELVSAGEINGNGDFDVFTSPSQASADGTRVWFETNERLVPEDTDELLDLYERSGSTTTRISAGQINGNGPLTAQFAGASADGARVYFLTTERLVAADTDVADDVYRRSDGTTTRISAGQINGNGHFRSSFAGVSADGLRTFFHTDEQLVVGDTDARRDVYERSGGVTTKVSPGNGPRAQHAASFRGASRDGSAVFFTTGEKLLGSDQDQVTDVYGARVAP